MNLYLIPLGLSNNIIYTQTYTPLNLMYNEGCEFLILSPNTFKSYITDNKLPVIFYDSIFEESKYIFKERKKLNSIYTRSILEFYILYFIKKFTFAKYKIRFDFRGLISDESYLRNKSTFRRFILKKMEHFIYLNASSLSTVSHNFKSYLQNEFNKKRDILITPCCTDNLNLKTYKESKIIKFIYVGSLSKWQNIEEILETYKTIVNNLNNCSLTIITNDVIKAKALCQKSNVIADCYSLKQSEIAKELAKYDFGFLLRENIPLNYVASPVKFLEYTSNGVIPIISDGVGDYSSIVKEKNIGIIVDEELNINLNKITELLHDPLIYSRLYEFSQEYQWQNYYRNFIM